MAKTYVVGQTVVTESSVLGKPEGLLSSLGIGGEVETMIFATNFVLRANLLDNLTDREVKAKAHSFRIAALAVSKGKLGHTRRGCSERCTDTEG